MASSIEFVEFVIEQLESAGTIRYKKMFGEYGIYCNNKYFAVICNDRFLVKITEEGKKIIPDSTMEPPYEVAKPMFLIEDLDDKDLLKRLTIATCLSLPEKKKK